MFIKLKRVVSCCFIILLCILMCSCGNAQEILLNGTYSKVEFFGLDSKIIDQNEKYSLVWDAEKSVFSLIENEKTLLTSAAYKVDNSSDDVLLSDLIIIKYFDSKAADQSIKQITTSSDDCVLHTKQENNKLYITADFIRLEITVTIAVGLTEKGINAEIVPSKITEGEQYRVYTVTLLPYLCSISNSSDNYVFVPDGCGAIMYTDERNNGLERTYSGEFYGEDLSKEIKQQTSNTRDIKMGYFGYHTPENSVCGIVSSGVEYATLNVNVGSKKQGFSTANVEFNIRGGNIMRTAVGDARNYTKGIISESALSIEYVILNAGGTYVDMAKCYQKHLSLNKSESKNTVLSLRILGGLKVKKFFFGVPYYSVQPLTTIEQANSIVEDVNKYCKSFDVQLLGFGESGLDLGKLAGNWKIANILGNNKQLIALDDFCKENSINMYYDYDVVNFSQSSTGYMKMSSSATTTNGMATQAYNYYLSMYGQDTDAGVARLLGRDKLETAINRSVKTLKELDIGGISFSSLSNTAYSDFRYTDYYVKGKIGDDVNNFLDSAKNKSMKVATSDANDYAARASDKVFECGTVSSNYNVFDEDVPAYYIVFKGYVPLASSSVNLSDNTNKQLLSAIETGSSISYTVIDTYKTEYATTYNSAILSSVYSDIDDVIKENVLSYTDLLEKIIDCEIEEHRIIASGVRYTKFENGIGVYINYNDYNYNFGTLNIPANSYLVA